MKFLFWAVASVVVVVLASFAVSNREAVTVGLFPLALALEMPLYLVVMASLVIGFLLGGAASWVQGRHRRREMRRRGYRLRELEEELAIAKSRLPAEPNSGLPAMPVRSALPTNRAA